MKCIALLALLLLLTGCAQQPQHRYFATNQGVYVLEEQERLIYTWQSDHRFYQHFYLLDGTPYLLDGSVVCRLEQDHSVTQLMTLEDVTPIERRHAASFGVTEADGVVTAYVVQADGGSLSADYGQADGTIIAQSTNGQRRSYSVPIHERAGFSLTATAIYTSQVRNPTGVVKKEEAQPAEATLYRTDLQTGQTEPVRQEIFDAIQLFDTAVYGDVFYVPLEYRSRDCVVPFLGERLALPPPVEEDGWRGSASSDGVLALWRDTTLTMLDIHTGTMLATTERGEDAWEDEFYNSGLFDLFTYGDTAIAVIPMESVAHFYVYVFDLAAGRLADRLIV